uniref:Uncharacterized protein n=1 Tax=Anguilla anguilla TaxID=7936 RepID=A0A0E9SET0_ANGAN
MWKRTLGKWIQCKKGSKFCDIFRRAYYLRRFTLLLTPNKIKQYFYL